MQTNPSLLYCAAVASKRAINGPRAEVTAFPPEITRDDNITFCHRVSKKTKTTPQNAVVVCGGTLLDLRYTFLPVV